MVTLRIYDPSAHVGGSQSVLLWNRWKMSRSLILYPRETLVSASLLNASHLRARWLSRKCELPLWASTPTLVVRLPFPFPLHCKNNFLSFFSSFFHFGPSMSQTRLSGNWLYLHLFATGNSPSQRKQRLEKASLQFLPTQPLARNRNTPGAANVV